MALLKFGKIDDQPKFAKFHHPNFYKSHMNIEQIYWKIFLRHMPNNVQLDTINHFLIAMACGSCEFLVHKVSLHLPNYYPIQIGTHGSLESLSIQNV